MKIFRITSAKCVFTHNFLFVFQQPLLKSALETKISLYLDINLGIYFQLHMKWGVDYSNYHRKMKENPFKPKYDDFSIMINLLKSQKAINISFPQFTNWQYNYLLYEKIRTRQSKYQMNVNCQFKLFLAEVERKTHYCRSRWKQNAIKTSKKVNNWHGRSISLIANYKPTLL